MMSTYNGAQYINQQLESIYNQKGLDDYVLNLFIRDDGSKDDTVNVVRSWNNRLSIDLIEGDNIGARESFFFLFKNAPVSDYYAFCDQDDYWHEDKLYKAISHMSKEGTLYFSNIEYIDTNGNKTGRNLLADNFELSLERILMCNPANGCAMVWDRKLYETIIMIPEATFTMHDEYVCTLAYLFGSVIYDNNSTMDYRIHESNVTQSDSIKKKYKLWKNIWFGRKQYSLDKRAKMLLQYMLKDEDRKVLTELSGYKKGINRIKLMTHYNCENPSIERSFRLRMLIGVL